MLAHLDFSCWSRVRVGPASRAIPFSLDAELDAATFSPPLALSPPWRGDRVAEGTRLLSGRRTKSYRGFESLPLRNTTAPRSLRPRVCSVPSGPALPDSSRTRRQRLERAVPGRILEDGFESPPSPLPDRRPTGPPEAERPRALRCLNPQGRGESVPSEPFQGGSWRTESNPSLSAARQASNRTPEAERLTGPALPQSSRTRRERSQRAVPGRILEDGFESLPLRCPTGVQQERPEARAPAGAALPHCRGRRARARSEPLQGGSWRTESNPSLSATRPPSEPPPEGERPRALRCLNPQGRGEGVPSEPFQGGSGDGFESLLSAAQQASNGRTPEAERPRARAARRHEVSRRGARCESWVPTRRAVGSPRRKARAESLSAALVDNSCHVRVARRLLKVAAR